MRLRVISTQSYLTNYCPKAHIFRHAHVVLKFLAYVNFQQETPHTPNSLLLLWEAVIIVVPLRVCTTLA